MRFKIFLANIFWVNCSFAHLSWATWANRSWSLICLEQSEWIAHSHSFNLSEMSKWANERCANERIPSPAYKYVCYTHFFVSMIYWMLQYVLHGVGNSFIGISIESIVFVIERSIQSLKRTNRVYKISTGSIRPRSIFLKDFKRSTRAIRSRSIFFKDRKDRKIEFPTLVLHNILKKNSFALFHIP